MAEKREPRITDHALLRFMERVHGVDVEALRKIMLSDKVRIACEMGASTIVLDGIEYIIENGVVVTVWVRKPKHEGRKSRKEMGPNDAANDDWEPHAREVKTRK